MVGLLAVVDLAVGDGDDVLVVRLKLTLFGDS
jgi:hypothetical protein